MFITDAPFSTAGLESYRPLVGEEAVERIRAMAAPLQGAKVLHVNSTPVGGGVAEMLLSLVPLMRDVGLEVDWYVLDAEDRFYEVTKGYHNALQGHAVPWSREAFDVYWEGCRANACTLAESWKDYDYVVVHDPQPLALRSQIDHGGRWIWRCHIDLTAPHREVWDRLAPHLGGYDLAVCSAPEYIPEDLEVDRVETALPCIDPFRPKNRPLSDDEMRPILHHYGLDNGRPYMLQVSRFDPWKDPVGVVEVYRRVRAEHPEIQLVYMASMAADDPEAHRVYREAEAAAGGDPDIHLLALEVPPGRVVQNALEVNALQRGARVVLQKSIREGFGLVVTEALWKEKPVVASNVGGIRYQICDGWNGFLVRSIDHCAERVLQLLDEPERAATLGRRGHHVVRSRFLFTRLLEQYLTWFRTLRGEDVAIAEPRLHRELATIPGVELPDVVAASDIQPVGPPRDTAA